MKKRAVASEVLDVYTRMSPSKLNIEDDKVFNTIENRLVSIIEDRLKFPRRFFKDINYLNLGCGTGEPDIIFATWGAYGIGIDINPISIERANNLRERFSVGHRLQYMVGNVEQPELNNKFGLVISDGVLPHVENPEKLLHAMCGNVESDGYLILGFLDLGGNIQRLLHGVIVRLLSEGNDHDVIENIAYSIFKDHLERCAQYGGRTVKAVINDYIINKHSYGIDTFQIIEFMRSNGFSLHTSYPFVERFVNSNPSDQASTQRTCNTDYSIFQQLCWTFAREYDEWDSEIRKSCKANIFFEGLNENILSADNSNECEVNEPFSDIFEFLDSVEDNLLGKATRDCRQGLFELKELLEALHKGKINNKNCLEYRRIFKGFNGFGTVYLSFKNVN